MPTIKCQTIQARCVVVVFVVISIRNAECVVHVVIQFTFHTIIQAKGNDDDDDENDRINKVKKLTTGSLKECRPHRKPNKIPTLYYNLQYILLRLTVLLTKANTILPEHSVAIYRFPIHLHSNRSQSFLHTSVFIRTVALSHL